MLEKTEGFEKSGLPVIVIGAGAVGLAAAAHLIKRGEKPLIIEAGERVGESILKWAHVRMFSPWKYNIDSAAKELLETSDWQHPEPENLPTGSELVESYLQPLAELPSIKPHLRLQTRVVSVTKQGFDKMKTTGGENTLFVIQTINSNGDEETILARAVIDASGTYETPNPVGSSGVFAEGERKLKENIFYGIPDVFGRDRARFSNKRVTVVGSGHSAANALLELVALSETETATQITWVIRSTNLQKVFGGGSNDKLPARGRLGTRLRELAETGQIKLVSGFKIAQIESSNEGIIIKSEFGQRLEPADEIIAATGFRPNLEILRELRLDLDLTVESPTALATLIDPNLHSCGTVYPHGAEELKHPEKDFYIVGMKSYGRAPTFLLMTGYEQVRSVVAAIAGDWKSAGQVELILPETGVCNTQFTPNLVQIQTPSAKSSCGTSSCSTAKESKTAIALN